MSVPLVNVLKHIRDEINFLRRSTANLSKDTFLADETLKRACVRSLEIIGEAVKQIPADRREIHPDIPWRAIAGMRDVGYSKEFAAGVICNAGTLGILIPPSIVMVVYAAATDVSVGRMFLAGILPGLIAGLMLMMGIYIAARFRGLP